MKFLKYLVAGLFVVSTAAQAQLRGYGTIEFTDEENRVTKADGIKTAFVIGGRNPTGWDFSTKLESGQARLGEGDISTSVEVRIRRHWANAIGIFSPWAGVRGGEAIRKDDNWVYYAVEGGVKFPLVGAFGGELGYRYRNATEQWRNYETHRGHATVSYALTKQDSVGGR